MFGVPVAVMAAIIPGGRAAAASGRRVAGVPSQEPPGHDRRQPFSRRQGADSVRSAALPSSLPRQDRGDQVWRQRHDRRASQAQLRARCGDAEAGGHQPGGGAWRWPADRAGADPHGQGRPLHPGHARHRRGNHVHRGDGAGRPGEQGDRRADQHGRRPGRGPDGAGWQPDPGEEAAAAQSGNAWPDGRHRPGGRHRAVRSRHHPHAGQPQLHSRGGAHRFG